MSIEGGRGGLEDMESSYDGTMWGDWGVVVGVIEDGWPEGVAMAVDLVDIGSM